MSKKQIAEKQEKQKEIATTQTWTVKQITYTDGTRKMERTNEGFTPLELLGMSDFISWEVREQILGRIVPDTVKREVVVS